MKSPAAGVRSRSAGPKSPDKAAGGVQEPETDGLHVDRLIRRHLIDYLDTGKEDLRHLRRDPKQLLSGVYDATSKVTKLTRYSTAQARVITAFVEHRNELVEEAAEFEDGLREKMRDLREKGERFIREQQAFEDRRDELQSRAQRAEEDAHALRQERDKLVKEVADSSAAAREAQQRLTECSAGEEAANTALAEEEKRAQALQEQLEAARTQLADTQRELVAAKADADRRAEALASTEEKLQAELDAARAEAAREAEAARDGSAKEAAAAKAGLEESQREAQQLRTELEELRKRSTRFEIDFGKAEAERDSARRDADSLRKQLDDNSASQRELMQSLMKSQELAGDREKQAAKRAEELDVEVKQRREEADQLRREALDLRSGLREAQATGQALTEKLEASTKANGEATESLQAARTDCARLEGELGATRSDLVALREQSKQDKEEADGRIADLEGALASAASKLEKLEGQHEEATARAKELGEQLQRVQAEAEEHQERASTLAKELETLKESADVCEEEQLQRLGQVSAEAESLRRQVKEMERLRTNLGATQEQVDQLMDEVFAGEMARRKLHNDMQDLRGNIRVFVRVRPTLKGDLPEDEPLRAGAPDEEVQERLELVPTSVDVAPDNTSLVLVPPMRGGGEGGVINAQGETVNSGRGGKPSKFSFDQVFGPRNSQEDVFGEVTHLVQSALDGFHVCLFSYGQTGSGKTHTMQGGPGDHAGLIPRSVQQILDTAARLGRQGWEYEVELSFLEIYNENVRDLLIDPKQAKARAKADAKKAAGGGSGRGGFGPGRGAGAAAGGTPSLTIHHDKDGSAEVPGLTKMRVHGASSVREALSLAAENRSVAATAMNAVSSRSHSVFTLYIHGRNERKGVQVKGTLNLCDLAGSERLRRSKAEGKALKETQNINKSLSCLADVFTSLARNSSHVPFRNSKLTYLLKPCFAGQGKTLMLVNVSPTEESAGETQCSLRFAQQVAQVHLGKAKKHVASASAAAPTPNGAAPPPRPGSAASAASAGSTDSGIRRSASASAARGRAKGGGRSAGSRSSSRTSRNGIATSRTRR